MQCDSQPFRPIRDVMTYEQLYSSTSDRETQTNKKNNIHQNTIDMQDYQAVTCV